MRQNIFDAQASEKLKKAGISDFFDMLLLAPSHYEDRRISESADLKNAKVYDVVVTGFKESPKLISFRLFCDSLEIEIEGIFFQKARYLKSQFPLQKRLLIYGKLVSNGFGYQIIHPKIVPNASGITTVYKCLIRSDIYAKMISQYVTKENILSCKVPPNIAEEIVKIHLPDGYFLSTMDENGFSKKSLESLKFLELFAFLSKFSAKKRDFPSKALKKKNISSFVEHLPFAPTNSQKTAFSDILNDTSKDIQARRIFIGDVGSGKSVVIAFACFLAYPNRSLVLAPTSILANQLSIELARFLPKELRVRLLTQKSKLNDDEIKEAHVLVGTHALLHRELPPFDVIMVDEQHRFGSAQRALIDQLTARDVTRAHYFQFSATPIPRTLAMVNSAIIDVTLMKDLPFEKNITTKVISKPDFGELLERIKDESAHDRQVVIVYPLVEESETIDYMSIEQGASFWQDRFDGVYVTHGRDKDKDKVLEDFRNDGKILVATTLVEVGVSLPRLSTIVIVGAERLGLASLHQLRGRVSRNGLQGYCFLYTNNPKNERLGEFANTISGFDIAELDLKYRSAGDLLGGVVQSGKSFRWFDYATDERVAEAVKGYFEIS